MHKINFLVASVVWFITVLSWSCGKISIESLLMVTMIYFIGSAILFSLKRIIELKEEEVKKKPLE